MCEQPFRGVLRKRCSGNMQQIYGRTPMPKCDFKKVVLQLYWNCTGHRSSHVNLLHILRTPFSKNTSEWLLLGFIYIRNLLSVLLSFLYKRFSCVYFFLKNSFFKRIPVSIFSWQTLFLKAGLECQTPNTVSTDFSKILKTLFVKLCCSVVCILLVHTKFNFFYLSGFVLFCSVINFL